MTDVIGFGLTNIDLVAEVEEKFLAQFGIGKGLERHLSDLEFGRMRAALDRFDALPGGCLGNTLCGLAAMGVDTRFYGKVGADEFESLYRTSFRDYMVAFDVEAADGESPQCAVLVTPDGERSFAQTEGTGFLLSEDDVDWDEAARARILYAEIYACAFGGNTRFFERLCDTARANGIPLYIKVIDRDYGAKYRALLHRHAAEGSISLIVGNADNLPVLVNEDSAAHIREGFLNWPCDIVMTAAGKGGSFFSGGTRRDFTVERLETPKNSSGAGDQFMAGFIAAKLDNRPLEDCFALGARQARRILTHHQPRPPLPTRQTIRF